MDVKLSGSDILVASLKEQGVDVVFGYPGGTALEIYDALYRAQDKLRHVLVAHEQGATHAADGYTRTTKKTGVVIATSGPGATNLVTGLATASLDSVPMVAITANVPIALLGKDSFQEVDIIGVTVPVTKHGIMVMKVEDIPEAVKKAFTIANSGRPGPVIIDIPKDVTQAMADYIPVGHFEKRPTPTLKTHQIDAAVEAINKAKKPYIYFGGGVKIAQAEDILLAFSQKIDAPMASSIMGLSCVPYDNPRYLGMIGMHGRAVSNKATEDTDLLITIGARFSDRIIGDKSKFAAGAKVMHIETDRSEIGKNIEVDYPVIGDAREILEILTERIEPKKNPEWIEYLQQYKKDVRPSGEYPFEGVSPIDVIEAVSRITNYEALVATDVGQHQMLVAHHYKFTKPNSFASSCGLGTMGYGMGAANGVQIGNPDKPVVLFTGDGCFHMNMNELAVAVSENLPIVVLIMNNSVLGLVRQWQATFYDKRYSNTDITRKTDFVKLAEAMGATGMRISQGAEIDDVLTKAFATKGPVVVDCIVDKDFGVYPFIPSGKAYKDTILNGDYSN